MSDFKSLSSVIKKRSRRAMTLQLKRELIKLSDSGMRNCEICHKYNLSASTVATIIKDKSRILEEVKKSTPLLSTVIRKRGGIIAEMETHLISWIQEQLRQGISLTIREIQTEALRIFGEIKRNYKDSDETFQASKGWFCRFQNRHNLHNIKNFTETNTNDITESSKTPNNDAIGRKSPDHSNKIANMIKQEEVSVDETNFDYIQPISPANETLDETEVFHPENSGEHEDTRWIYNESHLTNNNNNNNNNSNKHNHDSLDETNSTISSMVNKAKTKISNYYDRMETEDDSIDLLFKSYAKLLRKFTPKRQILVKTKIHQIFMDAEYEEVEEMENNSN